MPTYASTTEVREFTGAQPKWLGLADDAALDAWLNEWISKAEEEINDFTNNSWTDADLPGTVNTAVIRYVANAIKSARRHRAEQVMRVDDLTEGRLQPLQPADSFLTKPIKDSLLPYRKRLQSAIGGSHSVKVKSPIGEDDGLSPFQRATFGDWEYLAYRYPRVDRSQMVNRI